MTALESHREAFLEASRARGHSPATIQGRHKDLALFFGFLVATRGMDDAREVSRRTIEDYQAWMAERKLATRTVQGRLVTLRSFFGHLEAQSLILVNPCDGVRLPKIGRPLPRRILSHRQARAVLDAPNTQSKVGIRDKAMLELFYSTGIRVGEMTRLTIHDVDARNALVRINQGKGRRDRVVPMGRKACDYVREYISKVRSVWSKDRRDERALWLGNKTPHLPLQLCSIDGMVARHGEKAGLAWHLSPHVWRHTCATHLVAAGANIAHVQKLLGHRSLQSTQIYTRVTIPEIKKTFKRTHPRERSRRVPSSSRLAGLRRIGRRSPFPG